MPEQQKNRKTENCTAVLFCFTTVPLPAFAGDVLRQIVVRASLNLDGMKSKSSPQNSGKPGRTCHTVPAKFYPSPVVFDRVRLARNCVACVLASIRGETNARGHQGRFRCLYTLMRGPTNKPFAAAMHESSFLRLDLSFASRAPPVPTAGYSRNLQAVKFACSSLCTIGVLRGTL